jgi:hypothetical protein
MVEKDVPPLVLTEGAGGFLPGVPLGCCLGMASQRWPQRLVPRPALPQRWLFEL